MWQQHTQQLSPPPSSPPQRHVCQSRYATLITECLPNEVAASAVRHIEEAVLAEPFAPAAAGGLAASAAATATAAAAGAHVLVVVCGDALCLLLLDASREQPCAPAVRVPWLAVAEVARATSEAAIVTSSSTGNNKVAASAGHAICVVTRHDASDAAAASAGDERAWAAALTNAGRGRRRVGGGRVWGGAAAAAAAAAAAPPGAGWLAWRAGEALRLAPVAAASDLQLFFHRLHAAWHSALVRAAISAAESKQAAQIAAAPPLSTSDARAIFERAAARLAGPQSSLLSPEDAEAMHALRALRASARGAAAAQELRRCFFASRGVAAFLAARVHAWGAVVTRFGGEHSSDGGGGAIGQQQQRQPTSRVLARLGLVGGLKPEEWLAAALTADAAASNPPPAQTTATAATPAHALWCRGQSIVSSAHTDPLKLSPLERRGGSYFFMHKHNKHGGSGCDGSDSEDGGEEWFDLASPAARRWERIVGRIYAAAAARKLVALLGWLSDELADAQGCAEGLLWLSEKAAAPAVATAAPPLAPIACTRALLAGLAALPLAPPPPGARDDDDSGGAPDGTGDLLFWCRSGAVEDTDGANGGSSSGSSGAGAAAAVPNTLDTLVGCVDGLLGLAAHARAAGRGGEAACLEDALREVSAAAAAATAPQQHALSQLLRRSLSRTVCLLVGATDSSLPNAAAARACAHASFLRCVVEILSPASSSLLLAAVCAAVTVEARLTLPPSPTVLTALAARGRQCDHSGAALAVAAQQRLAEALAAVAGAAAATVVGVDEAHAALGRVGAVPRAAGCVHVVV